MKTRKDDILDEDREDLESSTEDGASEETSAEAVSRSAPTAEEYERLSRERDELRDQLLRRRADFDNYRKRVERDREQAAIEARVQVLAGLLPTVDNLERALGAAVPGDADVLREGVQLIYRNLMAYLETQGVVARDPMGEMFDPQIHQALSHEAVPGTRPGTIVEVFQKAYFLKDRLIRPALVKVAKDGDVTPETRQ